MLEIRPQRELTEHEDEMWRAYRLAWADSENRKVERGFDSILSACRSEDAWKLATESREERLERELAKERRDKARIIGEGYGGTD